MSLTVSANEVDLFSGLINCHTPYIKNTISCTNAYVWVPRGDDGVIDNITEVDWNKPDTGHAIILRDSPKSEEAKSSYRVT